MGKTIAQFVLHRNLVDEGDYDIWLNGVKARVRVERIQNIESMEKIMEGFAFMGTVSMTHDQHGIFNIFKITITLPYYLEVGESEAKRFKKDCVANLNRLIEVVRYKTNKYWIPPINEHDIIFFNVLEKVDDAGKKRTGWVLVPDGLVLPLDAKNQTDVQDEIAEMLKNERVVPVFANLLLDSFNYFATGRFNESVIVANIALEEMVKNHLYDKLVREKGYSEEESEKEISAIFSDRKERGKRGLHRVMSINFKEIDGRSLEDNSKLWHEFNEEQHERMLFTHTPDILKSSKQT